MSDHDLPRDMTRHGEDAPAPEVDRDDAREPQMGNWPEIFGVLMTALLIWMCFAFRG